VIFYTVPGLTSTEFRHIDPDGTGDTLFATLPPNVASVGLNSAAANKTVFAYRASETSQYGLYYNSTVNFTGATQIVAPSFDFVDSLQVSSDGQFVYFVGTNGTNDSLYKVPINGSSAPVVLVNGGITHAHINQAGSQVVYAQVQSNNRAAVFVRPTTNTGSSTQLTEFFGTAGYDADFPQFSKDSTKVVFSADKDSASGTYDLFTIASVGGNLQRITNTQERDELGASFNNDGTAVSYVALDIDTTKSGIYRTSATATDQNTTLLKASTAVGNSTYWTSQSGRSRGIGAMVLDRRRHERH
jgi:hypothetical protein